MIKDTMTMKLPCSYEVWLDLSTGRANEANGALVKFGAEFVPLTADLHKTLQGIGVLGADEIRGLVEDVLNSEVVAKPVATETLDLWTQRLLHGFPERTDEVATHGLRVLLAEIDEELEVELRYEGSHRAADRETGETAGFVVEDVDVKIDGVAEPLDLDDVCGRQRADDCRATISDHEESADLDAKHQRGRD